MELLSGGWPGVAGRPHRDAPDQEKDAESEKEMNVSGRFAGERHHCPDDEHYYRPDDAEIHFALVDGELARL